MKRKWFDKKVLICGLSKSGTAAAEYLNSKGADCYLTEFKQAEDKDKELIETLEKEGIHVETGGHSDEFMQDAYVAIMSPGISPQKDIYKRLKEKNIPVMSEIELAYAETLSPFIAITGTNGKTTTTTLISHILCSEFDAPVCGNIGVPPTKLLDKKHDFLVCEMSSYQSELSHTIQPFIACFLNWSENHIDWHDGLDNYFKAKARLFALEKAPAFAVFNGADEKVYAFAEKYPYEKYIFAKETDKNCCYEKDGKLYFKAKKDPEEIIAVEDIPLVGEHNVQNVMVAIIAAKLCGVSNEKIAEKIKDFKAVEHRIEYVGTDGKHKFYNDSKSTTTEATIVALRAFPEKSVTLIMGGRDKMTDLTGLCQKVKECVNNVILIGEATQRFRENLEKNGYSNIYDAKSFEESIDKAIEYENEIILFSPACASFDMFDNFEHRGEEFKKYVGTKI
ncbi:MAG: UDP-N-acetylmuramoyl-L-alanine--D-glutamate ligase [Candidatus Gastranaerophilales bacterium]|nr:UDP-N-acetylmuramoyl-L-alanine--D-glutamate ligase [Candidatus Gastranaerophilales bacterium]